MSVARKVYARVVTEGVKVLVREMMRDEQGEFRKGRGCVNQIFTVRQLVEKACGEKWTIYAAFLKFEKA